MKKFSSLLILILVTLLATNCYARRKKKSDIQAQQIQTTELGSFDYLIIERNGGGDKLFNLVDNQNGTFTASFGRFAFRDTSFRVDIDTFYLGDSLNSKLKDLMNNKICLVNTDTTRGNAKPFFTGSWLRCRAVKDTTEIRVTNHDALEIIKEVERAVINKMTE